MGIKIRVECDYEGYCHQGPNYGIAEAIKDKWLQIAVCGNALTVMPFDGKCDSCFITCPVHLEEVLALAAREIAIVKAMLREDAQFPEVEPPASSV